MKVILRLAWPTTLQCVIASCSWMVLPRLVAETGGTTASAGYQIAVRNVAFFILPARGLSNAAATLVGQNPGTKKTGRAEHSVYLTAQYNALFMGLVMVLFLCFSRPIIRLFSQDDAVIAYGVKSLQILGSGSIFYSIGMVMTQALNGASDTRTPTAINFIGLWLFQIPLAHFLAQGLDWRATGVI